MTPLTTESLASAIKAEKLPPPSKLREISTRQGLRESLGAGERQHTRRKKPYRNIRPDSASPKVACGGGGSGDNDAEGEAASD